MRWKAIEKVTLIFLKDKQRQRRNTVYSKQFLPVLEAKGKVDSVWTEWTLQTKENDETSELGFLGTPKICASIEGDSFFLVNLPILQSCGIAIVAHWGL